MKKIFGLLFMLVAIALLIPGVTQPIFSLTGTVDKAALVDLGMQTLAEDPDVPDFLISVSQDLVAQLDIKGELPAYKKTRSIVGTVEELFEAKKFLVGGLIALFSIIIPLSKCLLMLVSTIARSSGLITMSDNIIRLISKWSMADVFVIAIFVAYLAANATRETETLFFFNAEFMPGFYYFLGYCLLSILSLQLIESDKRNGIRHRPATPEMQADD